MAEAQKKDFFVSYNRNDRAWAEWVAWQLEVAGYTTTIQAWDFGAGDDFILQMQKAAVECERTVGVLSPDSINAPFVQREWAAALAADPSSEKRKLVLARVRDFTPTGLYRALLYIDLVGRSAAEATELLLRGVRLERNKPSTAPPFPGALVSAPQALFPSARSACEPSYFPGGTTSVFLCAAAADLGYARTLRKHLAVAERSGVLRTWHRGDITPGMIIKTELEAHFDEAQLVVLLITKDFLACDECAAVRARVRAHRGQQEISVLVSPSLFRDTELGSAAALPRDGVPITRKRNAESAWADVAAEITTLARQPRPTVF